MNILQIEPSFGLSGGANQVVLNTRELIKRNHRVYLAAQKDSFVERSLGNLCEVIEIKEDSKESIRVIKSFLDKTKIDIVHTHHPKGHSIGLRVLPYKKTQKLVVQRGVIFTPQNFFKYLNPKVDAYVANSLAVKRSLKKIFVSEKKIHIIYSAIDEKHIEYIDRTTALRHLNLNGFIFGIIANYSVYKGHDLLLEAFARTDLDVKLAIIGRNTDSLQSKVNRLGISNKVKIYGLIENASKFMSAFNYLVIPSLKEALSNVIIEAFFRKIPTIGTNVGGIPELLDQNRGILAEPTIGGLKKALEYAFAHKDQDMTIRAYQFAKNHLTIEKKTDQLEQLYEGILLK